jgi:ABC-type transport system involved in multi-copper enzyme maturation permease subunit
MIKELKAIILSPKFAATLAVCTILTLLSIFVGIREYRASVSQFETARNLNDREVQGERRWRSLNSKAFRTPDPMQIFVSGVTYDIGQWTAISGSSGVRLQSSGYSNDPIYAIFRYFDFAFVVQFVFSLLAILFTFDSISGERESGVLKLIFSNPVPKAKFLLAKAAGVLLGLIVPISLPILMGLLLVQVSGIPMTASNWSQVAALIGTSLLYFMSFIMIGLLISSLTRSSNVSFLVSLVVWVLIVLIIPRAGVIAAGQIMPTPSYSEIDEEIGAYSRNQWTKFHNDVQNMFHSSQSDGNITLNDDIHSKMDSLGKERENSISKYEMKLLNDLRIRKAAQARLGLVLSRLSPASAYQLSAQELAGTDIGMKTRNEDAMLTYRDQFLDYTGRQKDDPMAGAITISIGSDGVHFNAFKGDALDISNIPKFAAPVRQMSNYLSSVVIDFGILSITLLLAFCGAFVGFLRYDVR